MTTNPRQHAVLALLLLATTFGAAARVAASMPDVSEISGTITDAESHEPVGWATVDLVELRRSVQSGADGVFLIRGVPPGRYTLRVRRLGYQSVERAVDVASAGTVRIELSLTATSLTTPTVVIAGDAERSSRPDETLTGAALQRGLGTTLAGTIAAQPGMAQRTMGPVAARPIVRGLGGDRLQLREDGSGSGDVSSMSADHAVAIDPINAERVEIVRGPAGLLLSGNALAGVVNLVRRRVADALPMQVTGIATVQVESAAPGVGAGVTATIPIGDLALALDASGRTSGDVRTPSGALDNTDHLGATGSIGLSGFASWGHLGGAVGAWRSEYGVPGDGHDHEEEVRIAMEREFAEARVEFVPEDTLWRRAAVRASYSSYHHRELEDHGTVGTEYRLRSGEIMTTVDHGPLGALARGTIGAQLTTRRLEAEGVAIPATRELGGAAFVYEELSLGALAVRGSLRYDAAAVTPDAPGVAPIGEIRRRTFGGLSGSIALAMDLGSNVRASATAMRTFRAPTTDELFADGVHLASYSYEIGNPDLQSERGLGLEAALHLAFEPGHVDVTVFRNAIDRYIAPRRTGDTTEEGLPVYRQSGLSALMFGGELDGELQLTDAFVFGLTMSHVVGELADEGTPLPAMPPFSGRASLTYRIGDVTLGAALRGAAAQRRVDEYELPTDDYLLSDLLVQWQGTAAGMLHSVVLTVENVTDAEWRNHLSRTKDFAPEAGRNVRLMYRATF